jgi:hypothetical protein
MMSCLTPVGNRFDSWSIVRMMPCAVVSAFDPGRWNTASATAGSRLR